MYGFKKKKQKNNEKTISKLIQNKIVKKKIVLKNISLKKKKEMVKAKEIIFTDLFAVCVMRKRWSLNILH